MLSSVMVFYMFMLPSHLNTYCLCLLQMYVCMYVCMYLLLFQYRDHLYFRGIVIGTFTFCGTWPSPGKNKSRFWSI